MDHKENENITKEVLTEVFDKLFKAIKCFLILTIYGFVNIFFMMWVGFDPGQTLQTLINFFGIFSYVIYIFCCFISIYVFLFRAKKFMRKIALFATLVPWILLSIIAIPQGMEGVLIFVITVAIYFLYIPGEPMVLYLNDKFENIWLRKIL